MNENTCPLCDQSETTFFAETRDHLLNTTKKVFSLRECRSCEIVFISPMPSADELRTYYPSGYWWSESDHADGFLPTLGKRLESLYRRIALRDHVRFVMKSIRHVEAAGEAVKLLDVGCSGGTLLHEIARRGFPGRGLDSSGEAVAHAREVYQLDCRVGELTQSPWDDEKFSLVTSFHVLEHVPDPKTFLKAARAVLTEQGRVVVQVPNIRSWQFRLFGDHWYGLDPPRHLVNFSDRALSRVLQEAGLQVVRQKRFSFRDDPAAWVSSLFPALDPLARTVRRRAARKSVPQSSALGILQNFVYFLLWLIAIPVALCDSLSGRGATIMIEARRIPEPSHNHSERQSDS